MVGVKPPYAIPPVAEIAALAGSTGLVAATTFAGCGGSSTGYRWAGLDVRWASEFHPGAADSYEANWPGTTVDRRDVRNVKGAEVLAACGVNELDLLDGSPPCQPFSMAGRREQNWNRAVDHSDGTINEGGSEDLVGEWVRLVREIQPRAAVMENVRGLTVGKAKGYLLGVLAELRSMGYRASARLLDAQWLGVPQRRVRLYVVAFRGDLGLDPVFPSPLPYRYVMADALPWLLGYEHNTGTPGYSYGHLDPTREPVPTIMISGNAASHHHKVTEAAVVIDTALGPRFTPKRIDQDREPASTITTMPDQYEVTAAPPPGDGPGFEQFAIGPEWEKLRPGGPSDRYFNLVRPDPDLPSPTLTAIGGQTGVASVTHPHEPRKFTILEVKRLCGFPDDYRLAGPYAEQWARLGNAVPPPMARAVGAVVAAALSGRERE